MFILLHLSMNVSIFSVIVTLSDFLICTCIDNFSSWLQRLLWLSWLMFMVFSIVKPKFWVASFVEAMKKFSIRLEFKSKIFCPNFVLLCHTFYLSFCKFVCLVLFFSRLEKNVVATHLLFLSCKTKRRDATVVLLFLFLVWFCVVLYYIEGWHSDLVFFASVMDKYSLV